VLRRRGSRRCRRCRAGGSATRAARDRSGRALPADTAVARRDGAGGGAVRCGPGARGGGGQPRPPRRRARPRPRGAARPRAPPADGAPLVPAVAPPPPRGTTIVSAPDPEDEVRAVVRDVMARAADGTALHRVAILFRVAEPYARLAHELLDAAGVPWSGPS